MSIEKDYELILVGHQQRYLDKKEGASIWNFCDYRTAKILKGRTDYEVREVYAKDFTRNNTL